MFLQDVLARLHRVAPGISFEFRQSSGRVQEELESGEVDFVIGPEIDVLNEHPKEVLFEDTYSVVAWTDSRLVGDTLEHRRVHGAQARGVPQRASRHRVARTLVRERYGDVRQIDVAAHDFMLLPHLVVDTDRIATVQTRLARTFLQHLPIRLIQPAFELPKLTEICNGTCTAIRIHAIRWLRTLLKEQAALLPPLARRYSLRSFPAHRPPAASGR